MISEIFKYFLIAVGGGLASSTLLLMYAVSTVTEANALHGTQREKLVAYGIRIAAAIFAYVMVVVIRRIFKASTEQSGMEALVLISAGIATLVYGGKSLKRWKESRTSGKR